MLVFFLAGPAYFIDVVRSATLHILGISAIAGLARLLFSRGGVVLSVVCGLLVSIAGFLVMLGLAISKI